MTFEHDAISETIAPNFLKLIIFNWDVYPCEVWRFREHLLQFLPVAYASMPFFLLPSSTIKTNCIRPAANGSIYFSRHAHFAILKNKKKKKPRDLEIFETPPLRDVPRDASPRNLFREFQNPSFKNSAARRSEY